MANLTRVRLNFGAKVEKAGLKPLYNKLHTYACGVYALEAEITNRGTRFYYKGKLVWMIGCEGASLRLFFPLEPSEVGHAKVIHTPSKKKNNPLTIVYKLSNPDRLREAKDLLDKAMAKLGIKASKNPIYLENVDIPIRTDVIRVREVYVDRPGLIEGEPLPSSEDGLPKEEEGAKPVDLAPEEPAPEEAAPEEEPVSEETPEEEPIPEETPEEALEEPETEEEPSEEEAEPSESEEEEPEEEPSEEEAEEESEEEESEPEEEEPSEEKPEEESEEEPEEEEETEEEEPESEEESEEETDEETDEESEEDEEKSSEDIEELPPEETGEVAQEVKINDHPISLGLYPKGRFKKGTLNAAQKAYLKKMKQLIDQNEDFQLLLLHLHEEGRKVSFGQTERHESKVFDESFIASLEEGFDAIDYLIINPRSSIKEEAVLMDAGLATRINARTVVHLSSHTHFVHDVDKYGNVIPEKLLAPKSEDNFQTYENRFLMTLIQKAALFVEKRYQYIKSHGETFDSDLLTLSGNTDIDGLTYVVQSRIHAYAPSEDEGKAEKNQNILERLIRLRGRVGYYMHSPFMQLMNEAKPIANPVHQTNMILKEPHYKKCYALWRFIDRYTELGVSYHIDQTYRRFDDESFQYLYALLAAEICTLHTAKAEMKKIGIKNEEKARILNPKVIFSLESETFHDGRFVYDQFPDAKPMRVEDIEFPSQEEVEAEIRALREKMREYKVKRVLVDEAVEAQKRKDIAKEAAERAEEEARQQRLREELEARRRAEEAELARQKAEEEAARRKEEEAAEEAYLATLRDQIARDAASERGEDYIEEKEEEETPEELPEEEETDSFEEEEEKTEEDDLDSFRASIIAEFEKEKAEAEAEAKAEEEKKAAEDAAQAEAEKKAAEEAARAEAEKKAAEEAARREEIEKARKEAEEEAARKAAEEAARREEIEKARKEAAEEAERKAAEEAARAEAEKEAAEEAARAKAEKKAAPAPAKGKKKTVRSGRVYVRHRDEEGNVKSVTLENAEEKDE